MKVIKAKKIKGITDVLRLGDKVVIHHHQSIKQSANYQTAEAGYGITLEVGNTDLDIKKGAHRLERLVEELMASKFREQRKLLQNINTETRMEDTE
jgi:hypothetical protein